MTKLPPPSVPSPVIEAIRKAASEQGVTAYALAKSTGHSNSTIQRFLAGEVSPSLATVEAIAKALGLVVDVRKAKR